MSVTEGHYPTLAVAATKDAWYAWVSPRLLDASQKDELIPMGDPSKQRLIIGHNVSYDRVRIREEYRLKGTNTRFLDTMR